MTFIQTNIQVQTAFITKKKFYLEYCKIRVYGFLTMITKTILFLFLFYNILYVKFSPVLLYTKYEVSFL